MGNLFNVKGGKMLSVLTKIAERLPAELGDEIDLHPELADIMVNALRAHLKLADKNPFETSIEEQITWLRLANEEEGWGFAEDVFSRLTETAPVWPEGRLAVRSLRIRFGEGDEGVASTFEAHAARIRKIFAGHHWRWPELKSGKDSLRLLVGNHTHKPIVEWVIADLDTHRKRKSITDVRGPQSLADELLVVAWMFPDLIRAIDYDKIPGFYAAGYEVNVPDCDEWAHVVIVGFHQVDRQVELSANPRDGDSSDYAVSVLREKKS